MIGPGLTPGAPTNKSAETRMENTKTAAKQATLVGNPAAQQSLKKQTSQVKVAPVGKLELPKREAPVPVELPSGGPALPPEVSEGFDPEVFKEDMLSNMIGQIRTEQLIQSPRVKDAVTSIKVKEFFNQSNNHKRPDSRSLFEQVINRMGM